MKIAIRDIPDIGLNFEKVLSGRDIGLNDDAFKCLTPLEIKARIEKAQDAVLIKVQVKAKYEFVCSRCLEPIQQDRIDQFDLYFEITPTSDYIELGDDIRQEMLISLSAIVLCRKDCRGMCPDCGVNLNKEPCRCVTKSKQPTGLFRQQ